MWRTTYIFVLKHVQNCGHSALTTFDLNFVRKFTRTEDFVHRRLQQNEKTDPKNDRNLANGPKSPSASDMSSLIRAPSPSPAPLPSGSAGPESPSVPPVPPPSGSSPKPPSASPKNHQTASSKNHQTAILTGSIAGGIFLVISVIGIYLYMNNKVATVKPWATGLSGQLQKAFVTGNSFFSVESLDLCICVYVFVYPIWYIIIILFLAVILIMHISLGPSMYT